MRIRLMKNFFSDEATRQIALVLLGLALCAVGGFAAAEFFNWYNSPPQLAGSLLFFR
jgi:uncharacterized membrane protein